MEIRSWSPIGQLRQQDEGKKERIGGKTNIPGGFFIKRKKNIAFFALISPQNYNSQKALQVVTIRDSRLSPEGRWELWFAPSTSVCFPQQLALQHPGCFARIKLP